MDFFWKSLIARKIEQRKKTWKIFNSYGRYVPQTGGSLRTSCTIKVCL